MRKHLLIISLLITLISYGCATPTIYTKSPMVTYDKDTEYAVDTTEDGFSNTVYYSRYQFIPESDAVVAACRSSLTSLAYEYAEKRGRQIQPINEQRIKLSMGRNGFTGITSCCATVSVKWNK